MAATKAKILSSLLAALIAVGFSASPSFAQTKRPSRPTAPKRDSGQNAIVVVDGAAVYESANFDSPVMDYLDRGKSVFVSRKLYKGAGGLGAFYKMRVRKGVFGYITDVDVQVSGKAARPEKSRPVTKAQEEADPNDPTQIQPDIEDATPRDPSPGGVGIYLTRYLGASIAQYTYAEEIAKKTVSGPLTAFGLKMTGPGDMLGGLPLDLEINVSTSVPSEFTKYYQSASGFMLLGHAMAVLPAMETKSFMIYYGLGIASRYSRFDIVLKNNANKKALDSQELTIGAAGELGAAYAFSRRYVLRADVRYYLEAESYPGFAVAFQVKF